MIDPNPQLNEIVRLAREVPGPTSEQESAAWHKLSGALAGGSLPTTTTSSASGSGGVVLKLVVAVIVTTGGVWMLTAKGGDTQDSSPGPIAAAEPPQAAAALVQATVARGGSDAHAESSPSLELSTVIPGARIPTSSLAEDVASLTEARPKKRTDSTAVDKADLPSSASESDENMLLARVQAALQAGRAREVLRLCKRHRSLFPDGMLEPEFAAAEILALCSLGRHAEARQRADRFLAVWSATPLAARVRTSCGGLAPVTDVPGSGN